MVVAYAQSIYSDGDAGRKTLGEGNSMMMPVKKGDGREEVVCRGVEVFGTVSIF